MLILTSKTPWRRRPSGLVEIDRANPLTHGLSHVIEPPGWKDLVSGDVATLTGNPPIGATEDIGAIATTSSTNYVSFNAPNAFYPSTYVYWAKAPGVQYTTTVMHGVDGTTNSGIRVGWGTNSARLSYTLATIAEYQPSDGSLDCTTGAWYFCAFTAVNEIDTLVMYRGEWPTGVLASYSTTIGSAGGTPTKIISGIGNSFGPSQEMGPIYRWDRVLSPAEIAYLYAPETRWSLYAPLVRKTYFDLSAGGGSTFTPQVIMVL